MKIILAVYLLALTLFWFRIHYINVLVDKAIDAVRKKCWDAVADGKEYEFYFQYISNINFGNMVIDIRKWTFYQFFPELVTVTGNERKSKSGRWSWVLKK